MSQSAAERVRGPPTHMWNRHKTTIEELYITHKNTLKEVMKTMAAKGFIASEQQYKIKFNEWGFSKYKKRGGENRLDRVDLSRNQADRTTVAIRGQVSEPQLPQASLQPPQTSSADASTGDLGYDNIMVPDLNDISTFNMYFPLNTFEPMNLGILQGDGPMAPSGPRTTGTKIRQPIHQAAQSGYLDMVKLLLEKDPTCAGIPGTDGATAIWIAAQQGHLEVVRHLIGFPGVDVNAATMESSRTPIHQAAQGGHVDVVKLLLMENAWPDLVDSDNITPLWSAAQQGHDEIAQILIARGINLEITSTDGNRRPIHQAAQNGRVEVVKTLLGAGAKVDPHKDSYDDETPSPLWLAAQQGHCEVAKLLIENGADVNFCIYPSKRPPIHQAAQNGYAEVVRLLIDNGADVNAREMDDWPPLMIAAQQNYTETIDLLLEHGAIVNAEEKDGATALWIASQQGHAQVIQKLLDKGAKPTATRSSLRRPIHQAAQNGHLEAVKLLLEADPRDVNAEDEKGCTPLLLASQGETTGHLEVARYLIGQDAQVIT